MPDDEPEVHELSPGAFMAVTEGDRLADAEEYARWFAVHEEPKLARLMTVLLAEYDRQRVALAHIAELHKCSEQHCDGCSGWAVPCPTYQLTAMWRRPDTGEAGR